MAPIAPWCVIVNSKSCKISVWESWKIKFDLHSIPYEVYLTGSIDALQPILERKVKKGNRHFLFAGGDGTLHHGGNILMKFSKDIRTEIVLGVLPCGTGNDWIRTFGVAPSRIIESLQQKNSIPLNLLKLQWPDGNIRYVFNMLGGALDAAVVDTINNSRYDFGGFLKYPIGMLATLLKKHNWPGSITVDQKSFEDDWLTIEAGFGKYCGGGMYVLPHADKNHPALLLMKQKSFARIITSLPKLYNGNINMQKEAISTHFKKIEINHTQKPIPLQADGEWVGYSPVIINAEMGAIRRLI